MTRSDIAALLAIGAAMCNALTSLLQRVAASTAPEDSTFSRRLILYLIRQPIWWLGVVAILGAFGFQGLALYFGQISTVQPILASELVFIMLILVLWFRNPLGLREWGGAVAISAGLGVFLYVANPTASKSSPTSAAWIEAAAATLVAVALAIALAHRGSDSRKAAFYGSAAAIIWAFTAAVTKAMTGVIRVGWSQLFLHWPVYAVIIFGACGLIVAQSAFQAGPFGASQPAFMIVDAMVSVLIGLILFGDRVDAGPVNVMIESLAFLVMAIGAFVLSRSPMVSGSKSETLVRPGHERSSYSTMAAN